MNPGSISSKISTPFFNEGLTFLETFMQLCYVDEETDDFLKTTRHVTLNLENVRRLRRSTAGHLSTCDLTWIDTIIKDTEDALGSLAKLVERARVEKETKDRIGLWNRVWWVFKYSPMGKDKIMKLTLCHHSLLSIFPFLFKNSGQLSSVAEEAGTGDVSPNRPEIERWLDWQGQQQRRRSNMNLRGASSIQRPTSVSSGSTNATATSVMSSTGQATTMSTSPESSSPTGS